MRDPARMGDRTSTPQIRPVDLPQENDYLWKTADVGSKPGGPHHYRDLPVIGSCTTVDEVGDITAALSALALGQFFTSGTLADAMMADDRINGVVTTRLDALASLPLEVAPRTQKKKATRRADQLVEEWPTWIAAAELKRILMWGRMIGLGIGEILWETSEGYWRPRVKAWDPRYTYWRWDTRSFWMITMDGVVELRPGDGHWILFCPWGYCRGWMMSMIRPLARPFLWRQWAMRDWARYSEVHGLPIKKAFVPAESNAEDKENFVSDLQNLGNEGIVRLPRAIDGQNGYDLELCEPTSQSWDGFRAECEKADECIAVTVLGQNLTTSAKSGGSYALGNVHDRIRLDRLEDDAVSLGACMEQQLVIPWATYNWGDVSLAPHVRWSTKAPENRKASADTLLSLGNGLIAVRKAGMNVDLVETAKRQQIPLIEGEPTIEPDLSGGGGGFPQGKPEPEAPDNAEEVEKKTDDEKDEG